MDNSTSPDTVTYASLLDRIVETGGYVLPDGTDMWTIRTVHPDLRSSRDYRWPYPGNWAEAPGPIHEDSTDPCPAAVGDGLCVATTWAGMASGGIPASTLLLCAINTADALSPIWGEKIRVRRAYVVDVIDGARAVCTLGAGADLEGANLSGASLRRASLYKATLDGANLNGANLSGASLRRASLYKATLDGANLGGANLYSADLRGADLTGAHLTGANLRGAHLTGANLRGAYLTGANLRGAHLTGANLRGAHLTGANLRGADLTGADLHRADLYRADLYGAIWDLATTWPAGFDPAEVSK